MNGEKCVICGKVMGNSLQVDDDGNPAHKKCLNMELIVNKKEAS